ncbi:uncharacterized protein LOC118416978 [Branchiostoma floridae]|uniref:Uncharacterized protein LOC118416978 n=2 Tax=Branchiostoma floridae TaxID=7739 RepID=A0A9J7L8T0_BRAFL|nr:uncharacterized protein LOC118416978 [Branchiostoma floridae]
MERHDTFASSWLSGLFMFTIVYYVNEYYIIIAAICMRCRSLFAVKGNKERAETDSNLKDDQPTRPRRKARAPHRVDVVPESPLVEETLSQSFARLSVYIPESSHESSQSQDSENNAPDNKESLPLLNTFLQSRDVSPVRSLKKSWSESSDRSKRRHVQKAKESVVAVLNTIAPRDSGSLWKDLRDSGAIDKAVGAHAEEGTVDGDLLQAMTECYNHADSWAVRRQILSIMADKVQLKQLQMFIPGLTRFRYMLARHHQILHGRGTPVPTTISRRMKVDPAKLDHFLSFITSPHILQDMPFGERTLKMSNGQEIKMPNVIRLMIPSRIIAQYNQYCMESGFVPMGERSLSRILSTCAASTRKSLQGLDYFTSEGGRAFEELENVVDTLVDSGMSSSWGKEQKERLRASKRYLKGDYKVHVSGESPVPDHCRVYALSDDTDEAFQGSCNHDHDKLCGPCEDYKVVISAINDAVATCQFTSDEDKDEVEFVVNKATEAIQSWKAHQLRTVNQDEARLDVIAELNEQKVLITQDWAMKFIPQKYRESQMDWFGKRGISWHIAVAQRYCNGMFETKTFVHIFDSCNQDTCAVSAILSDVLMTLKHQHPEINKVYLRQDNAGCYHCGNTIAAAHLLAQTGISIERVDFSDPQGGKGPCDRKAATVKSNMRIYMNEGHDLTTASEMMQAMSATSVAADITVSNLPKAKASVKFDGISLLHNFQLTTSGVRVWQAYNIGPGKFFPWSKFKGTPVVPPLNVLERHTDDFRQAHVHSSAQVLKSDESDESSPASSTEEDSPGASESAKQPRVKLFCCPEEGCIKSYQRFSSLQKHLDIGPHVRMIERETLMDEAILGYAEKVDAGISSVPQLIHSEDETAVTHEAALAALPMGWALKGAKRMRARFSEKQRKYLEDKFDIGQATGRKCDPTQVAKDMRRAKDSKGRRMFTSSEFLTSTQVSSFFSRLAARRKCQGIPEKVQEEGEEELYEEDLTHEMHVAQESLFATVIRELGLTHPVLFDTYNLCDLYAKHKLATLGLPLLQMICDSFGLDTQHITLRRKAPYITKLEQLVETCSCRVERT